MAATLSVGRDETSLAHLPVSLTSSSLRQWLRGDWALMFSHSEDFACHDIESDRWIRVVQQACAGAGVLPLEVASRSTHNRSWVTEIGGMRVEPPDQPRSNMVDTDLQVRALRDATSRSSSRSVLILDESLRLRRTFIYARDDHLPSVLDLIAMAANVRRRAHRQ